MNTPFSFRTIAGWVLAATLAGTAQPPPILRAQQGGGSTLQTLYSFGTVAHDGASPLAGLVQATDGYLYGTTFYGGTGTHNGTAGDGTVYRLDPKSGALTILSSFGASATGGITPSAGLVQAADGNLYGTTGNGGQFLYGTVYRVDPKSGATATVYAFGGVAQDGESPQAGLLQAADGNLYGTTSYGGGSGGGPGNGSGTVYRIDPRSGHETVVYTFQGGANDGARPEAGVIQAADGLLYGTTLYGGGTATSGDGVGTGNGTVYRIDPQSGTETLVHAFAGGANDGALPVSGLFQAKDGNLYGATKLGGGVGGRGDFGAVYRIDPKSGQETVVFFFKNVAGAAVNVGQFPTTGLVQAPDGGLYGTTSRGGGGNNGAVYRIDPESGVATPAYLFGNVANDGIDPEGTLVLAADGNLYGTTYQGGGSQNGGTVYRLVPGATTPPPPAAGAPVIATAALPAGAVGQAYSFQVAATNNPTGFGATGLPAGLSISGSGLISGTPTAAGTFPVGLSATNAAGTGSLTLNLSVSAAPVASLATVSLRVTVPVGYRADRSPAVVQVRRLPTDDPGVAVTVAYAVGGTAVGGTDYQTLGGQVTIAAGQRAGKIKVKPLKEKGAPKKVTVVITLTPAADGSYTLGSAATAQVKIRKAP